MPKLTINNKADLAKLKKKMQKRIAAELDVPIRKTRDISTKPFKDAALFGNVSASAVVPGEVIAGDSFKDS